MSEFPAAKGLAKLASDGNLKTLELQSAPSRSVRRKRRKMRRRSLTRLGELTIVVKTKAGEGGTLFGAITSKQIAEALEAQGIKIDKRKIELEEPIRTLG